MKALWLVVKRCGGCEWLVTVVAFVICIFVAAVVCCAFAVIVACYFVVVVVVCYFVVVVFYFVVVVVVYNFDVVDKIGYNFFGVVLVVIVVVVVGAVVGILTGKAIGKRGRHAVVLGKRFRRCLLATTTATATATATAPTTATSTTTTFTITTTTISSITTIISASIAARCTACAANHLMFVGWFDAGGVGKRKTGLGISRPSLASRVTPSGQMGMFQL